MPGESRRVLGVVLGLGAASSGILACGLVVSFDRYDTDDRATRLFALRGTVDGLEGQSLAITVNGGPPTTVENGDFVVEHALVDGESFTVAASAPGQRCTVERGSGVVAGADWTGVAIHCASSDGTVVGLSVVAATLAPAFDPTRLTYGALLSWREPQTTVTLTMRSAHGHFAVDDGALIPSGTPSAPFDLPNGRQVSVLAIAADGTRAPSPYVVSLRRNDYLKSSTSIPTGRPSTNIEFGSAVAVSSDGSTLAVGAPYENSAATGTGGNQSDTTAPAAGAVYVFTRAAGSWAQQAYVKASNTRTNARFGFSLALSANGDRLVVGASEESGPAVGVNGDQTGTSSPSAGAVYAFSRVGGTWSQDAYLKASNTTTQGKFGRFGSALALSASGDVLAVGAPTEASSGTGIDGVQDTGPEAFAGAVYVFARPAGVWSQRAYLKASTASDNLFGTAVALSSDGQTLAVGAPGDSSAARGIGGVPTPGALPKAGAAYVFVDAGGASSWSQQAYAKASSSAASAVFGTAVALSSTGSVLAVGAPGEASGAAGVGGDENDRTAPVAGAAYVLSRAGVAWSGDAYIKASNPRSGASFGTALALSGDGTVLVVGATYDASSATGVNGDAASVDSAGAGAATVFQSPGGGAAWAERAYLKASNTDARAGMGNAIGISADGVTIGVGAAHESGAATGVNGDQSKLTAPDTGAVYVF